MLTRRYLVYMIQGFSLKNSGDDKIGASHPVRLFWIAAWTLLWKSLLMT
jgi:hypothetical protein